ncbi:MAG: squalene/phytoene synthase family protein [Verrucomicrobiota bacterium JB023]|nr:squalene/phytoene synthase family protein [Verrucomicrobiota bacterium JB023]
MSTSRPQELGTGVLRDVSRSFYLTLRWLPKKMRAATSVGYLLARASDTIADCEGDRALRLELLAAFPSQLEEVEQGFLRQCADLAEAEGVKPGEAVLLRRLDEVFAWLRALDEGEQRAIRQVIGTITSGQRWDLTYFTGEGLVEVEEPEQARLYCYQVAGCVGEFWTEVGFLADPRFASRDGEEMKRLGRQYGEGLQLINILRDEQEDRQRGRRYLPGQRKDWLAEAEEKMQSGLTYARAVRGWRARVATVLPALIGRETLLLLNEREGPVKVNRTVVKKCLRRAMFFR